MTTTIHPVGPVLAPAQVVPAVFVLLQQARRGLREADALTAADQRYVTAHLAALRAAAAVLAARATPASDPRLRRRRPTSVWTLLAGVAPELGEWAAFFATSATKRAAAEAGVRTAVTVREADDLVRDARTFLRLVETTLGLVAPTVG